MGPLKSGSRHVFTIFVDEHPPAANAATARHIRTESRRCIANLLSRAENRAAPQQMLCGVSKKFRSRALSSPKRMYLAECKRPLPARERPFASEGDGARTR